MADELEQDDELDYEIGTPTAIEEPELPTEFDDEGGGRSLAEVEEESPHQSDLQSVLKYLHPKYKDKKLNELMQSAADSRVFPDNFEAKSRLTAVSLIEEYAEKEENVDVIGIIMMVQDGISIGFEGRGRIEDLEVAGVANEQEIEKISRELGI